MRDTDMCKTFMILLLISVIVSAPAARGRTVPPGPFVTENGRDNGKRFSYASFGEASSINTTETTSIKRPVAPLDYHPTAMPETWMDPRLLIKFGGEHRQKRMCGRICGFPAWPVYLLI
ncbi:hypothetical protein B5F81_04295 [Muribaculum sp. An287]|nr:hypothetical protein B5F81_04295 [Muribaculum sp. An287]